MSEPRPIASAPAPAAASEARKAALAETTEALPWPSSHEIRKDANPFTDPDWRMMLYAWSGLLVRLTLIFGAIFTVYQFLETREQTRVTRTLELVELWERGDYQQAQGALKQRLADLNRQYRDLLGPDPTAKELAAYYERIGLQALEGGDPAAGEAFDRILYFLNRVAFCVQGDLCSRPVADAYFRDYAVSFWQYFAGYIERRRKEGATSYARPIEDYLAAR